jgi:HEAT repeat protein
MAVTMSDVLAEIDPDEPEYEKAAAKLGTDALPLLQEIVESDDPMRASKATYLAALIGGDEAAPAVESAASHQDPRVRVAAAHAMGTERVAPSLALDRLLDDSDAGVRKVALRAAAESKSAHLKAKITTISKKDPEEYVRSAAKDVVKRL